VGFSTQHGTPRGDGSGTTSRRAIISAASAAIALLLHDQRGTVVPPPGEVTVNQLADHLPLRLPSHLTLLVN